MQGKGESTSSQQQSSGTNGDKLDPRDDGNIFGLELWNKTDLNNPNFLFHRCCEERRLPAACVQRCHFNTYEKEVLESMFVGTDECPIDFLPEMQFCAAQGMDHRRVSVKFCSFVSVVKSA
ncbi:DB module [Oesophagostomum dentatum]|uniref:DB module n=1 Tax=Oesophagostomum dentatum TaxID=61180 RepID=A0A0B1RVM0_OESDE|nr:DB module [Oesophagostomum dentatum]